MKVSIAIPCYEMYGRGVECLDHSLSAISRQTYKDIEVVISDHSRDDAIYTVVRRWAANLDIRYVRFEEMRGSSSANHNSCIRHCSGDIIKFLCQDDYLYDKLALKTIVDAFLPEANWLLSRYIHTRDRVNYFRPQYPTLNKSIHVSNTVGTHSCLTIRNVDPPLFDENLIWFMDCEYYRRLYDIYGAPYILNELTTAVFLWEGQVSNTTASSQALRQGELDYLQRKYPFDIDEPISSREYSLFQKLSRKIHRQLSFLRET
ncbi:glycosyltransferase family A protein [Methylococcus sp. EFPC2]|uniref:glycosyltransferase family 2 protein n=1 Tax=Methylococcus sp. EFPC2 TaxID=2812648 RepID=UPI001967DD2F|nr:glycosyltransferase family A protein [Methylococcus sp. EFPC2]QSA96745.1 glycosyltransferase [Methylococcus sp. EFPC2]